MSRLKDAYNALVGTKNHSFSYEKPLYRALSNFLYGEDTLEKLISEGYAGNNHVYSIVNSIAESGADIPLLITDTKSNGDVEIIDGGDFYDFVHNPNPEENYKSFTYKSLVYQLITGNEIHYGVKGVGSNYFTERWNLAPQYIIPKVTNLITGPQATSYKYNYNSKEYNLDVEEVMHLRKFNPDPADENAVMGLSPLSAAYRTLSASNEIITADASLIKNKGAIGLLSSKGDRGVTPEQGKELDKALKSKIGGGENFGSIKVTGGNFDYIKFAMSPADLQILESGIVKLRDLCSVYGVSSRMFNDPNGTTFNNSKEDGKKFYTRGVLPPLRNDLDHFNKFFVTGWNERDNANYKVDLDLSSIEALQEDKKMEAEKDKIVMDGVNVILNMPISPEGKKTLLIDTYGFDEVAAELITNVQENE